QPQVREWAASSPREPEWQMRYPWSRFFPQQGQDMLFHLIWSEGLANVAASAGRKRCHHVRFAAFSGDHHDRNPFSTFDLGDLADEFQSIHDRHIDVAQNEVDHVALQRGQRLRPVRGFHDLVQFDTRLTQRALDDFAHHRGVIHDERSDLIHRFSPHWFAPRCGSRGWVTKIRPQNRAPSFLADLLYIGSSIWCFREWGCDFHNQRTYQVGTEPLAERCRTRFLHLPFSSWNPLCLEEIYDPARRPALRRSQSTAAKHPDHRLRRDRDRSGHACLDVPQLARRT